jgi:hypothetical protein
MHGAEGDVCVNALCDDGLLILSELLFGVFGLFNVEKLACAQSEYHGLVVVLQMVVNLGEHERSKLAVAEVLIFKEGFSVSELSVYCFARGVF